MAKWKCEICNSEFDNFQAQGFDGVIYCPLCYFKRLNNEKDKEIERLNNIINKAIDYIENCEWKDYPIQTTTHHKLREEIIGKDLLNILKGEDNE